MHLEHAHALLVSEIPKSLVRITPTRNSGAPTKDFLRAYFEDVYELHEKQSFTAEPTKLTIAYVTLSSRETWSSVARELTEDGWRGGSLSEWRTDRTLSDICDTRLMVLPGIRYRNSDHREWIVTARQQKKIFRKTVNEVSLRPVTWLGVGTYDTVLVSKVEILKD